MTDEQINKEIAVLRGWRFVEDDPDYEPYWEDPAGNMIGEKNTVSFPNSAGCLNAMHEAECWLSDSYPATYELYCREVAKVAHYPITVAAIVRAKLFVKTLGKWEDKA